MKLSNLTAQPVNCADGPHISSSTMLSFRCNWWSVLFHKTLSLFWTKSHEIYKRCYPKVTEVWSMLVNQTPLVTMKWVHVVTLIYMDAFVVGRHFYIAIFVCDYDFAITIWENNIPVSTCFKFNKTATKTHKMLVQNTILYQCFRQDRNVWLV